MSLCSLLSPRSGFRCCCAAPPPPAQPHQEARGGLVSPGTHAAARKRSSTFRRPPALPLATRSPLSQAKSARGGRCHSRVGAQSKRKPELALARCIPAAERWYLPSYTFHIIISEPWCKRDALLLLLSAPSDYLGRQVGSFPKETHGWGFVRKPARLE